MNDDGVSVLSIRCPLCYGELKLTATGFVRCESAHFRISKEVMLTLLDAFMIDGMIPAQNIENLMYALVLQNPIPALN